ncbi:cullin-1-like [Magnolia sinica]|uniref:cullin-1-like n=1 Tax=Magnolia sinica TaxID=86752 RepID=UPI002659A8AC|nr:cullin-1-like [Magnolia sinica]
MLEEPIELEVGWSLMRKGIDKVEAILDGQPELSFTLAEHIQLYTTIYNLCGQFPPYGHSEELYKRYRQSIRDYINSKVLVSLKEKQYLSLLRELVRRWRNHKVYIGYLYEFFSYLDLYYTCHLSLPPLKELGRLCFYYMVYVKVNGRIKDVVLDLIDKEREGEQIDRALIKSIVDVFIEVGKGGRMELYENDFEAPMLDSTANYYAQKASKHFDEDSCLQYIMMVERCLKREKDMAFCCLHSSSEPKLLERVQHEMLFMYMSQLLENEHTGLHVLLRDDKVEHLSRVYNIFSKITGGLELASEIYKKHVTEEGLALVKCADDAMSQKTENIDTIESRDQVFVRDLITLHNRYMGYVKNNFMNHALFHKALKESFEVFCNKDVAGNPPPELLLICVDNTLKKGGVTEKLSDDAVDEMLDKIVGVLAYIHDKDIFAELCRRKLACRLLFDRSTNVDHERSLLTKLKQQWTGQLTSKMEGMVMDLTLVRENQQNFESYLQENPHENAGIDLAVTVLTSDFWPMDKSSDLNPPSEMISGVEVFMKYYQSKAKNRKLMWISSLGTCVLTGRFKPKPIELVVTTRQAVTLLLFNASEKLSYQEIALQLNLTDAIVTRLLHSLSCAGYKILNKKPNNKTVSKSDTFEVNSMFTDKKRKIKVPLPPMDEKKKAMEIVQNDRQCTIDAAIVRIMKSRKALSFQQLVTECMKQIDHMFRPDFKLVKRRIEALIHRDYLEREQDNPNAIRYIS